MNESRFNCIKHCAWAFGIYMLVNVIVPAAVVHGIPAPVSAQQLSALRTLLFSFAGLL